MKNFDEQLDIIKNIKMIEMLKCQILTGVADLHSNLINSNGDFNERIEIFADLTILIYILAKKLGISPEALQVKMNKKLKIGVLDENDSFNEDVKEILRYFNGK